MTCLNMREKWNELSSNNWANDSTEMVLSEPLAHIVLHFPKLPDRQTATVFGLFRSGVRVFLNEIRS